eukprot:2680003-Prymnesium_polylepis.1
MMKDGALAMAITADDAPQLFLGVEVDGHREHGRDLARVLDAAGVERRRRHGHLPRLALDRLDVGRLVVPHLDGAPLVILDTHAEAEEVQDATGLRVE